MPRYSDGLLLTWQLAAYEAQQRQYDAIEPAHFFIALCKIPELPLDQVVPVGSWDDTVDKLSHIEKEITELRLVFQQVKLDTVTFRRRLRQRLGLGGTNVSTEGMHRNAEARMLFKRMEDRCLVTGEASIRPIHLLWMLCVDPAALWQDALGETGIRLQELADAAHALIIKDPAAAGGENASQPQPADAPSQSGTPLLDRFGRDLTKLARENKLKPVIGRIEEIRELGRALLRFKHSNAILVGDAGVGKTCVVESFAQRIGQDGALEELKNKRIIELQLSSVVAGTRYRGDFEDRLQGLLTEAANASDVVLFLDEIHTAIGAGDATGGGMNAANIMKPMLARGEIACIGATTTAEYRRYIEQDDAFSRRFEVIWIEEPTRQEAMEILLGLRPSLQEHHQCEISDDAIQAALDFSIRYATQRKLPDKAVDLVDEACAYARLQSIHIQGHLRILEREHVATVAAKRFRVPLDKLSLDETERLKNMEAILRRRVMGQDHAISAVANRIRAARQSLTSGKRPKGVFLFLGPTGTGKTELAKALAEFLHGDESKLITIDMSEYSENHQKSKLIGAPPGYVGYEKEGVLTSAIRTSPFSVVLLDEIEKAATEVLQLFLHVFDEGRLTDARGRRVSFVEATIIMTSNLGSQAFQKSKQIGFQKGEQPANGSRAIEEQISAAVRSKLPIELINRIDSTVIFNTLAMDTVRGIIDKVINEIQTQLKPIDITLTLAEEVYAFIAKQSQIDLYGARDLARLVNRLIVEPLGNQLAEGVIRQGECVNVVVDGDRLRITAQD